MKLPFYFSSFYSAKLTFPNESFLSVDFFVNKANNIAKNQMQQKWLQKSLSTGARVNTQNWILNTVTHIP